MGSALSTIGGAVAGGLTPFGIFGSAAGGYLGNKAGQSGPSASPYGYQPEPVRSNYQNGNLKGNLDAINTKMDTSGLDAFKHEAMRSGPSSWATQANTQQDLLQKNALNSGAKSAAGQNAQAENALAMRGGLTSGAQERIATEGNKNMLSMAQNATNQSNQNRTQIGINDEQNRVQELGMLPGMQTSVYQAGLAPQFQKAAMLQGDAQSQNAFNSNAYNQQMAAFGANQTANAIAGSGK